MVAPQPASAAGVSSPSSLGTSVPDTHLEGILQLGGVTAPHAKAIVYYGKLEDMHAADKDDLMMTLYQATQIQFPIANKGVDPIRIYLMQY